MDYFYSDLLMADLLDIGRSETAFRHSAGLVAAGRLLL
jgi:hypothetical protein